MAATTAVVLGLHPVSVSVAAAIAGPWGAGMITIFRGPAFLGRSGSRPGLVGALWFTNSGNNSIGRMTSAGVVTNYTGPGFSNPRGITAGPDGAMWFPNSSNNSIGRITSAGVVTNYTGRGISGPEGIAAGPDEGLVVYQ